MRGDSDVGVSRSEGALPDLRARYPQQPRIVVMDIQNQSSVRATFDGAFSASARIDIVISNAGYRLLGAAEEAGDMQVRDRAAQSREPELHGGSCSPAPGSR